MCIFMYVCTNGNCVGIHVNMYVLHIYAHIIYTGVNIYIYMY